MKLFLGGTCNNSAWREELIPHLEKIGIDYFNPVVDDWTAEAQKNEELEKKERCTHQVYVITPEMTGVFSIAEMVESAISRNAVTYICFLQKYDGTEFDMGQWRSLVAVGGLVSKYNGRVCTNLSDLLELITGRAYRID